MVPIFSDIFPANGYLAESFYVTLYAASNNTIITMYMKKLLIFLTTLLVWYPACSKLTLKIKNWEFSRLLLAAVELILLLLGI